ncbi:uncharacterized protein LOC135098446 [Scylla paramamosain]|uniref:uncharacterized protein LOC135098446 n=1 Tax=Scylla paramamosain TaxID=85552 RepID=UPI003082DD62
MFNQVYKVLAFKGPSTPTDTRTHHQIQEELIDELQNYSIVQVAAGDQHSLALTSWGLLGVNSCDSHTATRKLVKSLARKVTVQLACGANHTLALTADGDKIPWASWHLDTDRGPRREPCPGDLLGWHPLSPAGCCGSPLCCHDPGRLPAVVGVKQAGSTGLYSQG